MKKIIILLIVGVSVLFSCDEAFLDLYPETSITSPSFYKTMDHFDQALNATYTGLRNIAVNGMFMDEMRSDNAFYTIYYGDRGPYNAYEKPCLFIDDEVSANSGPIRDRWTVNYQNIAKANTIIDRLDASELSDAEKAKVRAEALFLRAFYYFDLVKCFGGVPLNLHEVTSSEEAFLPRSSVEECYTQILSDLNSAIDVGLPIPARFPNDNTGRATMGAARMLRAYVNMTKPSPDYTTAEIDLIEITKMNYKLLSSYEDVFNPQNKNHEEMIFDVQYTEDGSTNQYSVFAWRFAPKCSNLIDMMGVGGSNYAGTSGGWVVPTKEMVDSYESGDTRLPTSIVVVEGYSEGDNFYFEQIREAKDYVVPPGKDYRYMVNKYFNPPYTYSLRANENFPIYRYAGALLLLSECLVRQGKGSEALPFINQVRARAGISALSNVTLEDVANEMRHELAYENHRWSDLKRTGLVKEVMTAHGERIKDLHPWVRATNNDGCFIIDDFRMIYAIPTREIDINNLLEQNPGY
ncbi:MAG: RagB/SusD family nutrient uptake outer membrane protein [Proteiniphilum sp.]|uniref:RagB/SusD family nutrient uptake outer membrane protein n=1 Tax=Proteiniphilum sp. TaxID=1926877 RepID=UPI002ABC6947|nr:RagB/SusD family nutrient uptake outer membrane protein [Proteiniphilum sp.]MDY9918467.1 RagB/SusD family nutrient uptake outer membrane protein [Proteiniphilum sp.]